MYASCVNERDTGAEHIREPSVLSDGQLTARGKVVATRKWLAVILPVKESGSGLRPHLDKYGAACDAHRCRLRQVVNHAERRVQQVIGNASEVERRGRGAEHVARGEELGLPKVEQPVDEADQRLSVERCCLHRRADG